jgi:hypothetical protein
MFIDPSGRGKDETGWAIVKQLNGMLYLVDVGGFKDGYSADTLTALANLCKQWKVNWIQIEDNFGDGMFNELFKPYLRRIYPVTIDPEGKRSSTQKERRIIDTLEPVMNQHRLVVNKRIIEKDLKNYNDHPGDSWHKYMLFYQLTHVTKDKGALIHDDRLDALAGAVGYWVEAMARDQDNVIMEHKEELLRIDLERFMDNVFNKTDSRSDTWIRI